MNHCCRCISQPLKKHNDYATCILFSPYPSPKIPMFMQWENIALCPGSKKHIEKSPNFFSPKSMLVMVSKNVQILLKVLLWYKVNSTFQEGLLLKALYGEAGKVTKSLLISKIHPNVLWKFIPRGCMWHAQGRTNAPISYLQWSLALSLPLPCLNHLFISKMFKKKKKKG